jgi:hypothetical protein
MAHPGQVFKGQNDSWLEEYRLYHRDADGRVVAESDDAISASRYGLMMRRHARAAGWKTRFYRRLEYQPFGDCVDHQNRSFAGESSGVYS